MNAHEPLHRYLNDHLAGSDYAIALLERCVDGHDGDRLGSFFADLLTRIREDQDAARSLLTRIGGERSRLKQLSAWAGEKVTRWKLHDSPDAEPDLGLLEILEFLALGVHGKAALWDSLSAIAADGDLFGGLSLARLRERARSQRADIESARLEVARGLVRPADAGAGGAPGRARRDAVRAALLDIDGTLLDSNDAHARAWVEALSEAGRAVTFARVRPLIGMGGDQFLPEVAGIDADSEEGRRLSERRGRIFRERHLPGCVPYPGVRALLERMRGRGLTLVVATSASGDDLKRLLAAAGVADLIHGATSASDVEESKPEPDIVSAALDKAGVRAPQAVMIGDTPYDVAAASSAGVEIVGVRCGGSCAAELAGAVAVYDGPAHLLEELDRSPFGADPGATAPLPPAPG